MLTNGAFIVRHSARVRRDLFLSSCCGVCRLIVRWIASTARRGDHPEWTESTLTWTIDKDVGKTALHLNHSGWKEVTDFWLDIFLRDTQSNPVGIGASITVMSKSLGRQYNHMTTTVRYA